jgi:hypothetical protein
LPVAHKFEITLTELKINLIFASSTCMDAETKAYKFLPAQQDSVDCSSTFKASKNCLQGAEIDLI